MEELKTSPNEPAESAPAMAAKALDQELNVAPAATPAKTEVNDLTGLVKKKKKNPDPNGETAASSAAPGKRKAEEDTEDAQSEKKAKLEEKTT